MVLVQERVQEQAQGQVLAQEQVQARVLEQGQVPVRGRELERVLG